MPYLPTAQAWLEQSRLLLSARPTTTRITTKYTIKPPQPPSTKNTTDKSPPPQQQPTQPQPPKAFLTLKTYDTASHACLKYTTDKAAEVGRLVAALGSCGRLMAALPEKVEAEQDEATGVAASGAVAESHTEGKGAKAPAKDAKPGQGKTGGTGGGGGKKKKGKK